MTCTITDCDDPVRSRGVCGTHYQRLRRGRPLDKPKIRQATIEEAFEARVDRTDPSGCWLWRGQIRVDGYSILGFDNVKHRAHRIAYELYVGPIPEGLVLDHLCRNRSCVNPQHLEPVTIEENLRRGLCGVLRTHCSEGHELAGPNLMLTRGKRRCRKCSTEQGRLARERRREAERLALADDETRLIAANVYDRINPDGWRWDQLKSTEKTAWLTTHAAVIRGLIDLLREVS